MFELPWQSVLVIILPYVWTDKNIQHFGMCMCRCLVSSRVTYNNTSATNFSLYWRHFRRPVSLLGFTAIAVSCNIKFRKNQPPPPPKKLSKFLAWKNYFERCLFGSMEKKYHTLTLFQIWRVTFCSVDCNRDFHRKKHHSEVRNTNKWCCCLNINPTLRNWKAIKNKPFASKQLF